MELWRPKVAVHIAKAPITTDHARRPPSGKGRPSALILEDSGDPELVWSSTEDVISCISETMAEDAVEHGLHAVLSFVREWIAAVFAPSFATSAELFLRNG